MSKNWRNDLYDPLPWVVCRVDENEFTGKVDYFEVQAAYRKQDLDITGAFASGFVGPDDELVLITPIGKVQEIERPAESEWPPVCRGGDCGECVRGCEDLMLAEGG